MSKIGLDPHIHAPARLQLCAVLAALQEVEFQVLRDELGVSDSVLSKHIKVLEEAGYVGQRKGALNGRWRTWVRLKGAGRKAFGAHIQALKVLASIADMPAPDDDAD